MIPLSPRALNQTWIVWDVNRQTYVSGLAFHWWLSSYVWCSWQYQWCIWKALLPKTPGLNWCDFELQKQIGCELAYRYWPFLSRFPIKHSVPTGRLLQRSFFYKDKVPHRTNHRKSLTAKRVLLLNKSYSLRLRIGSGGLNLRPLQENLTKPNCLLHHFFRAYIKWGAFVQIFWFYFHHPSFTVWCHAACLLGNKR